MGPPEQIADHRSVPGAAHWHTAGERIQGLLDATALGGPVVRERAEQLVREVTDLYGAALERMLALATAADPALTEVFAADELVASLLLVHGLHPHDVRSRVAEALDNVRPYLGSHGGDVHLVEVTGHSVLLRFDGSCRECPSSAVTLELAVRDAIRTAAPEIETVEVVTVETASQPQVIPAESLLNRIHRRPSWQPVPDLTELTPGEVGGFRVAGTAVLACRVGGGDILVYRDRCPRCTHSMAGATLTGVVLRCPRCGTGYDVVRAGAQLDGDLHLEPIPALTRDGVLSLALTEGVA
ncbi:NifU family protein [Mycolicibacterium thermoresistibile]|jgi:Fe-S cluster biogenesis protein NfuA/nitrite reductase/ring-hydroxylating ferredoxin subunit|uniref:NifU domain-containing protein n=2 Tax=Mycolicibacterium thermoresistibile TaxID=1797 RepID=G7CID9_MYCT3|nr:NifU family protein [Mycolicibacterium thermoresistibile]EHI12546.1 NifU domain-containing protein [Mycolicibacterium thermoresistibile ATCC 19527]MCV7190188.1 NifU family protein [Mycolicibacterium thermoresistibile]GAT13752.1 thioredoxin-like protein [Mycolicibacterium thermoresistibile]SNW18925.1 thioredoxin-like protein [Mycolicibacterium thermoresistibile]